MMCPLCARALSPVERLGIELDYCTSCGGMWLDQGELNALVRRETLAALERGQDALLASRRDREYDQAVEVVDEPVHVFALSRAQKTVAVR